jgi:hypothetical protein
MKTRSRVAALVCTSALALLAGANELQAYASGLVYSYLGESCVSFSR